MHYTSLLIDMIIYASFYLAGIGTGVYFVKRKMEQKAEDMLDGLYED